MSRDAPERSTAGRIVAIVLAAGSSTRFGGQKLLADVSGHPLIRRTVSGVLESKVDEVVVVVGADGDGVRGALRGLDVAFVSNPRHAEGMGTSIAAGVRWLGRDVAAAVIALGDQPTAGGQLIDALIDEYRGGGRAIVIPEFEGVKAPPVVFGRDCFGALETLTGDAGAKGLVESNPSIVRVLAMEGRAPPDIDTRSDRDAFADGE